MMQPENPVNAIPPVVIALTLLILGVELVLQLANSGIIGGPQGLSWRLDAIGQYGLTVQHFDQVFLRGEYSFDLLKRFVTYPYVNWELTQVAFCAALTLALGKFTGEFYGGLRVLFVYVFSSVIGALAYGLLASGNLALFGGFTPVYGLIGAYTYALWLRLSQAGKNQLLAFQLIGVLLLIQLVFGLIFGTSPAWISELAGFLGGFGISVLLAPGGWSTFLNRMRQRS